MPRKAKANPAQSDVAVAPTPAVPALKPTPKKRVKKVAGAVADPEKVMAPTKPAEAKAKGGSEGVSYNDMEHFFQGMMKKYDVTKAVTQKKKAENEKVKSEAKAENAGIKADRVKTAKKKSEKASDDVPEYMKTSSY
jgi:hypothetical protein